MKAYVLFYLTVYLMTLFSLLGSWHSKPFLLSIISLDFYITVVQKPQRALGGSLVHNETITAAYLMDIVPQRGHKALQGRQKDVTQDIDTVSMLMRGQVQKTDELDTQGEKGVIGIVKIRDNMYLYVSI